MEAEAVPAARPRASRPHLRRVAFPLGLALTRLLRRGGPALLAAIGVAAAAAALAASGPAASPPRTRRCATARARSPPASARCAPTGSASRPGASFRALDRPRAPGARGCGQPAFASVVFREMRVAGALADLVASEDLGRYVHLTSGRLPGSCTPPAARSCSSPGRARSRARAGFARRRRPGALVSTVPFGSLVARTVGPGRSPTRWRGTARPSRRCSPRATRPAWRPSPLEPIYRSYAWVAPLPPVHPWSVAR